MIQDGGTSSRPLKRRCPRMQQRRQGPTSYHRGQGQKSRRRLAAIRVRFVKRKVIKVFRRRFPEGLDHLPKISPHSVRQNFDLPQGEGKAMCVSDELHIKLNGEELHLHTSGALWWAAERTLVFADLHFEKGSSFARGGQLLPPYDSRSTLARISALARHYKPARIIALGDSFHDRDAANRLDENERAVLRELGDAAEWIWIEGNHDPHPPTWLGGFITSEI